METVGRIGSAASPRRRWGSLSRRGLLSRACHRNAQRQKIILGGSVHVAGARLGRAAWRLASPGAVVHALVQNIADAQGYSDARGIYPGRLAVAQYNQGRGVLGMEPDEVFLGNGVSELIVMSLQALLDTGDEVLVPSPDYPMWTGAVTLCGGRAVHYRCQETAGWEPDLEHLEVQVTADTRALVVINPNNPTGAVYSRQAVLGLLEVARRHGLLVLADVTSELIPPARRSWARKAAGSSPVTGWAIGQGGSEARPVQPSRRSRR